MAGIAERGHCTPALIFAFKFDSVAVPNMSDEAQRLLWGQFVC